MATLTGSTVASTYTQLLKITSASLGVGASAKYIEDGAGTDSALSISTTQVGIGNAAPTAMLEVNNITINSDDYTSSDDFLGIRGNFKYTGASGKDFDSGEDLYGAIIAVEFDDSQSAGAFRNLIAVNGDSTATDCADSGTVIGGQFRGKVGHADADVNLVYGVEVTALITDGTVDTNVYGAKVLVDGDDGTVAGDVFGVDIDVDIEAPLEVAGDVIGLRVSIDDDDASAGVAYGMQINCASNVDAAIDLVGGGIQFPADAATSASANANTLDDYEEGDFDATNAMGDSDGGNTHTMNTTYNTLSYVKIGKLVHLQGYIQIASPNASASGDVTLLLPFQAVNGTELAGRCAGSVIIGYGEVNTGSGTQMNAMIEDNGTRMTFEATVVDGDRHAFDDADLHGSSEVSFMLGVTYISA